MPFTPSHVAAILPLARSPLPSAALAIGAMTPDLVFFIPFGPSREVSHSLIGAVTLDPILGMAGVALWWLLLRAPLLDLGPHGLRERMRPRPRVRRALDALLVLAAVLIGMATHLAWDAFTHRDALAAVWAPWAATMGPLPLTSWLQYASSAAGAAILVLWARSWWRRVPVDPSRIRVATPGETTAARIALTVVVVGAVICAAVVQAASGFPGGIPSFAFRVAVTPIAAGLAAVIVISVLWWLRHRPAQTALSRIRS